MNIQSEQEMYNELSYYTLSHPDQAFIHQHIVDAFAAQQADEETKPIKLLFALIGLYLYIEKGYSGRQVQKVHMQLAKKHREWPKFQLPEKRGEITVSQVLSAQPGQQRDKMIRKWCESVWEAYRESHEKIAYYFMVFAPK